VADTGVTGNGTAGERKKFKSTVSMCVIQICACMYLSDIHVYILESSEERRL
jgi:hypothetical protein